MKAVVVNRIARPELSDISLLIDSELPDPDVIPNDLLLRVEAVAWAS